MAKSKLFFDTNIFLDFFLADRSIQKPYIDQIFHRAFNYELEVGFADFSLINLNYFLKQRYKVEKKDANQYLQTILDQFEVVAPTKNQLQTGFNMAWKDYEDCIQFLIAQSWGADFIITSNVKDFKLSNVLVFTPKQFATKYLD